MEDAGADSPAAIASSILLAIGAPIRIHGLLLDVGCSIGIPSQPAGTWDRRSLLEAADQAIYKVKTSGKSGYAVFAA